MQRALVTRCVKRQTRHCSPRADILDMVPGAKPHKRLPPKGVGELPRVDYFQLFEEAYGAKEQWHRAEEHEMRKFIPIMARKIDDLRERVSDMHRYHRQYKLEATKELKKIPLYKREAWMSPDLTRSLLMEDLRSKGYLTESGELKSLEQLKEDIAKLAGPTQASLPPASQAPPAAPARTTTPKALEAVQTDATSLTAQPASQTPAAAPPSEQPLVVDPLLSDIHAPTFAPRPPEVNITAPTSNKVPSMRSILESANSTPGTLENIDKIWVRYPKGEVQATLDTKRNIVEIKPTQGSEHQYADPSPRRYGSDGREIGKAGGDTKTDRQVSEEDADREPYHEGEEVEEEEEDRVLGRLKEMKRKRKKQKSTLWAHLNEPDVLPGNVVYEKAIATLHEVNSEGKALSINEKIKEVEARMTAPETSIDLAGEYPAMPERGPDQMDRHNVLVQNSSLEELELSDDKIEYIHKRLRPPNITGAKFVTRLPVSEDQLPYQFPTTTKDGVWYSRSSVVGEPGKPLRGTRWPKEAVEVPFDVHKAATRGQGYAKIKALNTILELTGKIEDDDEE